MKVYEGLSKHDGRTVFVSMASLHTKSKNAKTDDMASANILVKETKPNDAVKTGEDQSECGHKIPIRANRKNRVMSR